MSDERKALIALIIYILGYVVTYGHAATHMECDQVKMEAPCSAHNAVVAVFVAAAWPLYISKEIWE